MAKLQEILQQERDRDTADKWNIIHLYKTGSFYSAYEWSAWLIAVITFNDAVRMATKDRKPIAVTRIKMANSEETFCRIGFPLNSLDKYIPTRLDFNSADDKHLVISIELPQLDDNPISYDRLAEAVEKWKVSQTIKTPKDKKDSDPHEDTDRQPTQGKSKQNLSRIVIGSQGGIISQIISYQLASHTPAENYEFIQRLQMQITSIL